MFESPPPKGPRSPNGSGLDDAERAEQGLADNALPAALVTLQIPGNGTQPRRFLLASHADVIRIGRSTKNDMVVSAKGSSLFHAELRVRPALVGGRQTLFVRDTSKHGTGLQRPGSSARDPIEKLAPGKDLPCRDGSYIVLPMLAKFSKGEKPTRLLVRMAEQQGTTFGSPFDGWMRAATATFPEESTTTPAWESTRKPLRDIVGNKKVINSQESLLSAWTDRQSTDSDDEDNPSLAKRCRELAVRLEGLVNSMMVQLFIFLVALAYPVGQVLMAESYVSKEQMQKDGWLLPCAGALVAITLGEFLIMVTSQAGPPFRPWSWWRFFRPLFHKFLAAMAGLMLFGVLLSVGELTENPLLTTNVGENRLRLNGTAALGVAYRVVRWWGIYVGVSVQATERLKKQSVLSSRARWATRKHSAAHEYRRRKSVRLQRVVDHFCSQFLLALLVLAYCSVYIATTQMLAGWESQARRQLLEDLYFVTKPWGYMLSAIFLFEVVVRAQAQGGERFFSLTMHKIEVLLLCAGLFNMTYASYYSNQIKSGQSGFQPGGIVTAFLLIAHRGIRMVAICYSVSASELEADGILTQKVLKFLSTNFGDIFDIPPQNVRVNISNGLGFTLEIHKAMLKEGALDDLHLPFHLAGLLIEDVHIKLRGVGVALGLHTSVDESWKHRSIITVRNVVFHLVPGGGLPEAGGVVPACQDSYWQYEHILERKAELVEFICRQLPLWCGDGREQKQDDDSFADRYQSFAEVDVRNFRIQYSDPRGLLGLGRMGIGLRVGAVRLCCLKGHKAICNLTRLAVSVDLADSESVTDDLDDKNCIILETQDLQHPDILTKMFARRNAIERFRLWGLEAAARRHKKTNSLLEDRRHLRNERLPERNDVLSLLQLRAQARPLQDHEETHADADYNEALYQDHEPVGPPPMMENEKAPEVPEWHWRVRARPLRVALDSQQSRCLLQVASCTQAWLNRDRAFQWRPNVEVSDATLTAGERRTVVRMWWTYAVHRVLADIRWQQPQAPWASWAWHSSSRRSLKVLLAGRAKRKRLAEFFAEQASDLIENSFKVMEKGVDLIAEKVHLKGDDGLDDQTNEELQWEERWQKELQVRLPLAEVILCRLDQLWSKNRKGWEKAKDEDRLVRSAESSAEIWAQPAPSHSWDAFIPVADIRLLRWRPRGAPRSALLHIKLTGVAADAIVRPEGGSSRLPSGVAVTATLDDISAACPVARSLTLNTGRHVCSVLKPLKPQNTRDSAPELLACRRFGRTSGLACAVRFATTKGRPDVLEVSLADLWVVLHEPLLLELSHHAGEREQIGVNSRTVRYSAAPPTGADVPQSSSSTLCTGRHLRHRPRPGEPLEVYSGRIGPMGEVMEVNDLPMYNAAGDEEDRLALEVQLHAQFAQETAATEETGIMESANAVIEAKRRVSELRAQWQFRDHAERVRMARRIADDLRDARQSFESLVLEQADRRGWQVHLHIGATSLTQASIYSKSDVLVEEYQIGPIHSSSGRQHGSRTVVFETPGGFVWPSEKEEAEEDQAEVFPEQIQLVDADTRQFGELNVVTDKAGPSTCCSGRRRRSSSASSAISTEPRGAFDIFCSCAPSSKPLLVADMPLPPVSSRRSRGWSPPARPSALGSLMPRQNYPVAGEACRPPRKADVLPDDGMMWPGTPTAAYPSSSRAPPAPVWPSRWSELAGEMPALSATISVVPMGTLLRRPSH